MRVSAAIAMTLLLSTAAHAQDETARKQAVEVAAARVPLEKPVTGAPYSADTIVESTQTLADGNHINRKTTGHVYRDSEGRTRREEDKTFSMMSANGPVSKLMTSMSIVDPVAGFSYSLDPEHKIAWKTPMGSAGVIMNKVEASSIEEKRKAENEQLAAAQKKLKAAAEGGGAENRREEPNVAELKARVGRAILPETPLEHKTIEGLAVEGRKHTTVIPAGAIGNEQPITETSEEWSSPELKVLVLTRHNDPRSGESTYYTVKETGIRRNQQEQ